jgi:hypothetical protein
MKGKRGRWCDRFPAVKFQAEYAIVFALVIILLFGVVYLVIPRMLGSTGLPGGTLTGRVTIGPLCPVEPCTIPDTLLREAYRARRVVVRDPVDGTIVVAVAPEPDTDYTVFLPPGTYLVDINPVGMDRSPDVPRTVVIQDNGTVRVDISIDTGLR